MGVRYFAGDGADAYLLRADIQRGLSVVVWRGRHVVEPTELSDEEAAAYGREVLAVGRALETTFSAVCSGSATGGPSGEGRSVSASSVAETAAWARRRRSVR